MMAWLLLFAMTSPWSAVSSNVATGPPQAEDGKNLQPAEKLIGDSCTAGNMATLYNMAPECFPPCENSCTAAGQAVTAYLMNGTQASMRRICDNVGFFECFLEASHVPTCGPVFEHIQALGFPLPASMAELKEICVQSRSTASSSPLLTARRWPVHAGRSSPEARGAKQAWSKNCSKGSVAVLYRMAPDCFAPCEKSCEAASKVVTTYWTRGGRKPAERVMCDHFEEIKCFVKPYMEACDPVFKHVQALGFPLPTSVDELSETCSKLSSGPSFRAHGRKVAKKLFP